MCSILCGNSHIFMLACCVNLDIEAIAMATLLDTQLDEPAGAIDVEALRDEVQSLRFQGNTLHQNLGNE